MGFKLVRLDHPEPAKIPLKEGVQIIGRGSFPDCNDYRISRRHARLNVTGDRVVLASLHRNPIFFRVPSTGLKRMIPQGQWVKLQSGHHFGLLPDSNWYELIYYKEDDTVENTNADAPPIPVSQPLTRRTLREKQRRAVNDYVTAVQPYCYDRLVAQTNRSSGRNTEYDEADDDSDRSTQNCDDLEDIVEFMPYLGHDTVMLQPVPPCRRNRSNLTNTNNTNTNTDGRENSAPPPNEDKKPEADKENCEDQSSPGKRAHSPDPIPDAKKVKTEPESPNGASEAPKTESSDTGETIDLQPSDTIQLNQPEDVGTPEIAVLNDADTDPQSPNHSNNVNIEPQESLAVTTKSQNPEMNTDSLGANDSSEPIISDEIKREPQSLITNTTQQESTDIIAQNPIDEGTEPQEPIDEAINAQDSVNEGSNPQDPEDEDFNSRDFTDEDMSAIDTIEQDNPSIDNIKKEPVSPDDTAEPKDSNSGTKHQDHVDGGPKPSSDDVKKEPDDKDVKKEPDDKDDKQVPDADKPGSSHDQPGCAAADGAPAPPARERCIYGVRCYRKNPQHKIQFSHPGDGDYGAGERGICPYGAHCRRREPRHWAAHDHPPPAAPLHPPQGMRVVERHGHTFYINAHTVHFHDDHFEVEDEDGDSVDFDYEF